MYIIVGLGNPGREYEHTRHNAGFDSVTALARSLGVSISKAKCKALVAETRIGSERVVLAQPQTYMNLSGQSVVELLNWYKCEPDHLIVIYDDIDLDAGRLRVRRHRPRAVSAPAERSPARSDRSRLPAGTSASARAHLRW